DHEVEPALFGADAVEHGLDLGVVGVVAGHRDRLPAARFDLGGGALQARELTGHVLDGTRGQVGARATRTDLQRDALADVLACAGDQRDLPGQLVGHGQLLLPGQFPDCLTVTTFLGLQSKVAGFFGNTRTNLPPFTWNRDVQGVAFLAGMSLVASIPSASDEWIFLASVRKLARVSAFTPPLFTTAFTASRKNRAAAQACSPLPSMTPPPTELTYALTAALSLASSTGTKGMSTYWPSAFAPAVSRKRFE